VVTDTEAERVGTTKPIDSRATSEPRRLGQFAIAEGKFSSLRAAEACATVSGEGDDLPGSTSEPHAMPTSADRNLLLGILALQTDFITRDALVAAMLAWSVAKHRPLEDILVDQAALEPVDRDLL
jgi:hypothetical protein